MEPGNTNPDTEVSDIINSVPYQKTSFPQNSYKDKDFNGTTNRGSSPDSASEGQGSADQVDNNSCFTSEIEALKKKLFELENQPKRGSAVFREDPVHMSNPGPETAHTNLMGDTEQYKGMEDCAAMRRKEWESNGVPESLECAMGYRNGRGKTAATYHGPLKYTQQDVTEPEFEHMHQGPFDPSPKCIKVPGGASDKDGYDHAIDYGAAKDRLRKNFEWDMDRLFLAEEMEVRRRKANTARHMFPQTEKTAMKEQDESKGSKHRASAKVHLNRQHWFTFKQLFHSDESDSCLIDILVGEPVISDDFGSSSYGYQTNHVREVRNLQDPETHAALASREGPLPERIRIHSILLIRILVMVGARVLLSSESGSFVLIRPFKLLFYCEQGLRNWCSGLEKQFRVSHDLSKAGRVSEISSEALLQPAIPEGVNDKAEFRSQFGSHKSPTDATTMAKANYEEAREEKVDPEHITRSAMALDHLKCLLSFMDSDILSRQNYLNSPKCRKVFFSDLWYLFRPGMEVIGREGKQAYRVTSVRSPRHRVVPAWQTWLWGSGDKKKKAAFSVTCVYIDFDGHSLGPVSKTFHIKKFDGEMEATSFPVYPLRLHPMTKNDFSEAEWLNLETFAPETRYRRKLIKRGTRFLEVISTRPMYYAGPTLGMSDEVESQVVIDFETAFAMGDEQQQAWKPNLEILLGGPISDPNENDDDNVNDPTCHAGCYMDEYVHDDSYIDDEEGKDYVNSLLPKTSGPNEQPSIAIIPQPLAELKDDHERNHYAISDDERVIMSYPQLDMTYLTDLYPLKMPINGFPKNNSPLNDKKEQNPGTTFDHLVLEEGQKPMIQALVAQHFRDKESRTGQAEPVDIVKGKGKGLILLLHGAPGVGKTSTAEAVAESFRKPLFQITCGDLGTTAKDVEKALDINFTFATRWDCILLLDEADVFLAQRNKEDFQRNGLVAVFLRVLEYYAGVLFLTTNRVGDFDEAFTSRIHVSLYYPELDKDKTLQIFKINIDMISERFGRKQRKLLIDDIKKCVSDYYDEHEETRWNGRQIRNACLTALALAEFEAQGRSHEAVLNPNAPVHLKISHFKLVQDAYLHFAEYMNSIYGTSSSTRAKEGKVRAIWIDENDRVIATQGLGGGLKSRKKAFQAASQSQPQAQALHVQQQLQQVYQQHALVQPQQGFPQQVFSTLSPGIPNLGGPQYYQQPNYGSPQYIYAQAPEQMHMGVPQSTGSNLTMSVGGSVTGQGQGHDQASPQPGATLFPHSQQPQTSPSGFDQNIQGIFAASSPKGAGQGSPSNLPSTGAGAYPPGQPQWPGS
ncbi:ATPase family AAA domain-containing protein 3B [Cytospora mali]|uniref:ATPase family AAA domain-containing protein 3B n=1 Tax=Cytospora mali TaxID=578113 RepID=A0A194UV58_CYTMA|nr:ATPase family AAA domain-containing protein 3B [Valsa mali var. pyri (nom. inval.)]